MTDKAWLQRFVFAASALFATGCPGDEVPVESETTPGTTGSSTTDPLTSTTSPSTSGSSSTTEAPVTTDPPGSSTTEDAPEESSSSGSIFETTSTSGPPATTTGEQTSTGEMTTTGDMTTTGMVMDQDCPYGTLNSPDTVMDTTLNQDSEFTSSCGGGGAPDVSYTLTAPMDGTYLIDTFGSSIDTILAVYDGTCGGPLIVCNNDDPVEGPQSAVSVSLTEGQTVTVVADGFGVLGGAVTINVTGFPGICPNGDLGNTVPQTQAGSTVGADNTFFGSCGGEDDGDDSYLFTAPSDAIYVIDTNGSDFDTILYLRDGCGGLQLACDDNSGVGAQSSITVALQEDDVVGVFVDGNEEGNYNINIDFACGNGMLDTGEECEGADLDGETCSGLGFAGGDLACAADCTYDLSDCNSCGDEVVNGTDACDGHALGMQNCESQGFGGGSLDCSPDCNSFDTSECSNTVIAYCSSPGSDIDSAFPDTLDTITVPDMGTVTDVDVFIDITHTWNADLDMSLSADDQGLSNNLFLDECGSSDDVWVFANDEGTPLGACTIPIGLEGNLTPEEPLSVYDGSPVAGDWTLTITDDTASDTGTLNQWCIYFTI